MDSTDEVYAVSLDGDAVAILISSYGFTVLDGGGNCFGCAFNSHNSILHNSSMPGYECVLSPIKMMDKVVRLSGKCTPEQKWMGHGNTQNLMEAMKDMAVIAMSHV
jgi:hypothetical protein